jgi:hypothetical protein
VQKKTARRLMFKGSVPLLRGDLAERLLRPADAGVVCRGDRQVARLAAPLDDAPAARDLPENLPRT